MNFQIFFFISLSFFCPSFSLWTDGDIGVDHMYSDIKSFTQTTNSTSECAQACAQVSACVGWVYSGGDPQLCGNALPTCYLKSEMNGNYTLNPCRISGYPSNVLSTPAFAFTTVGSVTPSGWLLNELETQAQGLTGFLPKFWADINSSSWIGGTADGGLHERTPYWLNGLVPLSFLTNDVNLVNLRNQYLGYIMDNQEASGWIGIDDMPTDGNQYWSRFNVILSLIQYYEGTSDPKAMTCIFKFLTEARRRMNLVPLAGWAQARGQDFIMALQWLIDNFDSLKGVPPGFSQAYLIDFSDIAHLQMTTPLGNTGGDWKTWFDTNSFPTSPACVTGMPCHMLTHGVNIGQAIKSEAVWYRRSGDVTDIDSTYVRMNKLDKYHGVPSGMFQADEHLAGNMQSHGTETCAVVEAVVSYAVSGGIIGDPILFDKAERILFNALPASMTKDMWERVYLQQSNEIEAITESDHIFITDGADSATFSLEGNYGCCTANMHAGWPKASYRAIGVPNDSLGGVAVLMWLPQTAMTQNATIAITTDYPFGDSATVVVTPSASALGTDVPVWLRIPAWANNATLSINGGQLVPLLGSNGTLYPTSTIGGVATTFTVNFNPEIRLETYASNTVTVTRGALVYTAWIGQNISVTHEYEYQSKDLAVTATLPWNLALVVDRENPSASLTFQRNGPPGSQPFSSTNIPVQITGTARVVSSWAVKHSAADTPPSSPACVNPSDCGNPMQITLVPFGSTHIRMTCLPTA
jgi:hypothetical protein